MANKIEKLVEAAVRPTIESMGAELVDVEYRTRDGVPNITVFIYRKEGTDLDTCEAVHRAIDPVLDEADPTGGESYVLNVSSPGLDRAFKTDRDFERNIGGDVEIKFYTPLNGNKRIEAKLLENRGGSILVEFEGKPLAVRKDKIAKICCAVKF